MSKKKGMPAPRFMSVPDRDTSLGKDAVRWAKKHGVVPDEHQELVLDSFMGVDKKGGWAAPECLLIEPRQNGKSLILIVRALYGLFELGEKNIIFSAHMWSSVYESFLFAVSVIEENEELADRVKIRRAMGDMGFTLVETGARVTFMTRSRQAARGKGADLVIADEAGWLSEAAHISLVPTLAARTGKGRAQIIYAGTAVDQAVHPDGLVLANIRRRGIAGDDPRLAFLEWSVECLDEDGNEQLPDLVPDRFLTDMDVAASCNAGVHAGRIAISHLEWEARALGKRGFAVERLCIGDYPTGTELEQGPIDVDRWLGLVDEEIKKITSEIVLALDGGPTQTSSIAIAGLQDNGDIVQVEIPYHRLSLRDLVDKIDRLDKDRSPCKILVDPVGLGAIAATQLEERGLTIERVSVAQMAEAVSAFTDEVNEGTLRHLGSRELLDAIRGAKVRTRGDVDLWSRRNATVDISPLVAASLAVWGARQFIRENDWAFY